MPIKSFFKDYIRFLKEHNQVIYLWGVIWIFNLNLASIIISFFAFYFYFAVSFDRRVRMTRKINLAEFNYFCTFTYDDKKHTEDTFKNKLRGCFKMLITFISNEQNLKLDLFLPSHFLNALFSLASFNMSPKGLEICRRLGTSAGK